MDMIFQGAKLLELLPQGFGVIVACFLLGVGTYLRYKKTEQEERRNDVEMHKMQVETLMAQVKALSEQLEFTRVQLDKVHSQNISLMHQLRESDKRIGELEAVIALHSITVQKRK